MKKLFAAWPQNSTLWAAVGVSLVLHGMLLSWRVSIKVKSRETQVGITVAQNRVITPQNRVIARGNYPDKAVSGRRTNVRQFDIPREREGLVNEMQRRDLLNTKQFLFSSYLERIRQNLEPVWSDRARSEHKRRPIPRGVDALTVGTIQDGTGQIIEVFVVESSGDAVVDELALGVIRGGLFPGVPKGLLDSDGFCRLYWTFRLRRH